jgi:hypothetical protein
VADGGQALWPVPHRDLGSRYPQFLPPPVGSGRPDQGASVRALHPGWAYPNRCRGDGRLVQRPLRARPAALEAIPQLPRRHAPLRLRLLTVDVPGQGHRPHLRCPAVDRRLAPGHHPALVRARHTSRRPDRLAALSPLAGIPRLADAYPGRNSLLPSRPGIALRAGLLVEMVPALRRLHPGHPAEHELGLLGRRSRTLHAARTLDHPCRRRLMVSAA